MVYSSSVSFRDVREEKRDGTDNRDCSQQVFALSTRIDVSTHVNRCHLRARARARSHVFTRFPGCISIALYDAHYVA